MDFRLLWCVSVSTGSSVVTSASITLVGDVDFELGGRGTGGPVHGGLGVHGKSLYLLSFPMNLKCSKKIKKNKVLILKSKCKSTEYSN